MAVFVLLAAMQRYTLAGFVDPNEGKAELRLARISLSIAMRDGMSGDSPCRAPTGKAI